MGPSLACLCRRCYRIITRNPHDTEPIAVGLCGIGHLSVLSSFTLPAILRRAAVIWGTIIGLIIVCRLRQASLVILVHPSSLARSAAYGETCRMYAL